MQVVETTFYLYRCCKDISVKLYKKCPVYRELLSEVQFLAVQCGIYLDLIIKVFLCYFLFKLCTGMLTTKKIITRA